MNVAVVANDVFESGLTESAYIRYAASKELDTLVVEYIEAMEQDKDPDLDHLLQIMDLFVAESIDTFVIHPANQLELRSGLLKMINSLVALVEKSSHMLVHKVAKKMSVQDHKNAAAYMKDIRQETLVEGQKGADICFPIDTSMAKLGLRTRNEMMLGKTQDPEVVKDGITFLHGIVDVANYWVFEEPLQVLQLKGVMKTLATSTVGGVKKATHTMVDKVVPKLNAQQKLASAQYFSALIGKGPLSDQHGIICDELSDLMDSPA